MNHARTAFVAFFCVLAMATSLTSAQESKFSVKIRDEKAVIADMENAGAIDPTKRINFDTQRFANQGFFINIRTLRNETLHLSHFPMFRINGRTVQPGQGGRFEKNAALGKTPGGRQRVGYSSSWLIDDLRITQTLELHPTKAKKLGEKHS